MSQQDSVFIVECPRCGTMFAVPYATFSRSKAGRCMRCRNVFPLREVPGTVASAIDPGVVEPQQSEGGV